MLSERLKAHDFDVGFIYYRTIRLSTHTQSKNKECQFTICHIEHFNLLDNRMYYNLNFQRI